VAAAFRKGFVVENVTIIIIAGRRAGFINVKTGPDYIYIDNIQISPIWQGNSLGTDILTRLLADHPKMSVRLTTFDDNPAKRLYERLGFVVTERIGMTVKMEA